MVKYTTTNHEIIIIFLQDLEQPWSLYVFSPLSLYHLLMHDTHLVSFEFQSDSVQIFSFQRHVGSNSHRLFAHFQPKPWNHGRPTFHITRSPRCGANPPCAAAQRNDPGCEPRGFHPTWWVASRSRGGGSFPGNKGAFRGEWNHSQFEDNPLGNAWRVHAIA